MLSLKTLKNFLFSLNCNEAAFFDENGELIISYKLDLSTAKRVSDLLIVLVSVSNNFGENYISIKGTDGYISVIDCVDFFAVLISEKEIDVDKVKKLIQNSFQSENCSNV